VRARPTRGASAAITNVIFEFKKVFDIVISLTFGMVQTKVQVGHGQNATRLDDEEGDQLCATSGEPLRGLGYRLRTL
jgi:hypothetical protein